MADVELATDEAGRSSIKDADADQAQLILALRGGDEAAFVSLVERHHAMLVRMARLYLPDCPDDVAHDVWIDLLRRLECLDAVAPSSFRSSDPSPGHWAVPVADWGQAPVARPLSRPTRDHVAPTAASPPTA